MPQNPIDKRRFGGRPRHLWGDFIKRLWMLCTICTKHLEECHIAINTLPVSWVSNLCICQSPRRLGQITHDAKSLSPSSPATLLELRSRRLFSCSPAPGLSFPAYPRTGPRVSSSSEPNASFSGKLPSEFPNPRVSTTMPHKPTQAGARRVCSQSPGGCDGSNPLLSYLRRPLPPRGSLLIEDLVTHERTQVRCHGLHDR